jgi:hypothetical protein
MQQVAVLGLFQFAQTFKVIQGGLDSGNQLIFGQPNVPLDLKFLFLLQFALAGGEGHSGFSQK